MKQNASDFIFLLLLFINLSTNMYQIIDLFEFQKLMIEVFITRAIVIMSQIIRNITTCYNNKLWKAYFNLI